MRSICPTRAAKRHERVKSGAGRSHGSIAVASTMKGFPSRDARHELSAKPSAPRPGVVRRTQKSQGIAACNHLLLPGLETANGKGRLHPLRHGHFYRDRPVSSRQHVVGAQKIDGAADRHGMQSSVIGIDVT
jgi:hypothetical protein